MLAGTKIELQCKEKLIRCNTFLVVLRQARIKDGFHFSNCNSDLCTDSKLSGSASDFSGPQVGRKTNSQYQGLQRCWQSIFDIQGSQWKRKNRKDLLSGNTYLLSLYSSTGTLYSCRKKVKILSITVENEKWKDNLQIH